MEQEVERLDLEMAREDLATNWTQLQEMAQEKSNLQSRIDQNFAEWEALEEQLARME